MSTEVAALDATPTASLDKNAQAAEDAKRMLSELQGESTAETDPAGASKEQTGDVQQDQSTAPDKVVEADTKDRNDEDESDTKNNRRERHDGRSSRGSGRGRGGYQPRNFRDNIKSDLTSQEESNDPIAIRKQVQHDFGILWSRKDAND